MNYYRRYMADYLSKTANLSLAEHGAYTLLLDYSYLADGVLPSDVDELCRMVRAITPSERQAVTKILSRFFVLGDGKYSNPRAAREIEKARPAMDAARANGVKGGRPKKNPVGFDEDNPVGSETEPSAKASQPLTPNHQPPAPIHHPPKKTKGAGSAFAAPSWIPVSAWQAFEQMRTKARKPMTDAARGLIVKELDSLKAKGFDPVAVLEQSVRNNWQDVYPLKDKGGNSTQSLSAYMAEQEANNAAN